MYEYDQSITCLLPVPDGHNPHKTMRCSPDNLYEQRKHQSTHIQYNYAQTVVNVKIAVAKLN